jgi:hypothetical protein
MFCDIKGWMLPAACCWGWALINQSEYAEGC